jgi:hypothetical protein
MSASVVTFVPRMDDFELTVYTQEQPELLPMAAREIDQALLDVEIEIHRTSSQDDALNACLVLGVFIQRLQALQSLAVDRAEALNTVKES